MLRSKIIILANTYILNKLLLNLVLELLRITQYEVKELTKVGNVIIEVYV